MDYDDNDFQGQNLHLAGEGSAKFPPVLRPYALSKFDFDENLQANVRFDSFVESETFLGIESNEDHQWIDAYSRGGSGIEFNSNPTASCSISRHDNVWSEATSSESVEMLLKSVGQEEYIPRQTSIQQLDAFDELACLAKQMDSNSKLDDKNEFKDNVADLQPPDVTHTSCSALKEDVRMEQSQAGVSRSHEGEPSLDVCQNIDIPLSEGNPTPFTDDKSNSTNQREVETVIDDSHPGKTLDDSSAFVVQTNSTESSMRNVGDEQQGPLQTLTNDEDLEYSVVNKEAVVDPRTVDGNAVEGNAHHPDNSFCSFPTEETLEGTSAVEGLETRLGSLEDSLRAGSVPVSELQKAERSSEDNCSFDVSRDSGNEDVNLLKDVVMDDQSVLNTCESPKVSIKDDSVYEKQVVEVSNSDGETCPNLQQNVDAVEKKTFSGSSVMKENELLSTGDPMDAEILSNKSETPMVTAEENNFSIVVEGNSDNRVGSVSSFGVVASLAKSTVLGVVSSPLSADSRETELTPSTVSINVIPSNNSELLRDTASGYLHDVGACSAVKIGESQGTIDDKVIKECTKEIGVPPVLCESSEKQGDDLPVSITKDDKETLNENDDKSSPKKLGDILLGNEGPIASAPLPVSCVELHETGSFPADSTFNPSSALGSPSQTEKDESEAKASANQTLPVSDLKNSGANNTLPAAQDLKGNAASKDKRNSTPELNSVVDLSQKEIADVNTEDDGKRQSVPASATNNATTAVEGSPSTSGLCPSKTKTVENVSLGNSPISGGVVARSASKATPERKPRRSYNKKAGKESSKRGSRLKDTTPARQSERGDKSTKVSLSPPPGFQLMQSNEGKQYGPIDSNSRKSHTLVNTSTAGLPDLNTSASTPVSFHQPFTDLQQVQLRAQIFVYGALIQGIVPDEAYMISAFGGPDGGRSIWENGWHACMEKQRGKKSHPVNPETPLQSRPGARTSDLAVKQSPVQGKGISSLLGQASSSKATPTTANPLIPLSSPLWSLPTLSGDTLQSSGLTRGSVVDYPQPLATLHPYQSPPVRNFLGHNTSWLSQASIRGPWISSPTPAPSTHLSASPVFDTIKLGSGKGSSLPPSSSIKNVTPGPPASSAGLQGIFVGTASLLDVINVAVSPAQHSSDPKPKKRKKGVVSEDLGQKALQSLTPAVSNHTSTSFAVLTPLGNVPVTAVEKSIVPVSPLDNQPENDGNVEKRILSDESLMKVKEAKVYAEEASALSAAAVNHSLELWNQLDKYKNSRLMPDVEAKLASAAVAVAAAAAVAKAAAAAANVASNAAFQAKLMADEALISSGYEKSSQSNKFSLSEGTGNLGNATPASILKGGDGPNSPIIVAAKEAVRRRVEAASAASKRAENMDAIVKAAELAAEAVSQAGKVVTMNDPIPLSDLIEGGPEGYWKNRVSSQEAGLLNDLAKGPVNIENVGDIPETSHIHNRDISSGGDSVPIKINENNSRGPKGHKVYDLVKPVDMVSGSEPEIWAPSSIVKNGSENLEENNFKEGSLVEVFKDEEGYKAAWFVANILSLKDDKAFVCYTSLVPVEGAGPLKEWVSLEHDGDKPPRIRTARPLTSLQHEGTRKRRRAAMGDYAWSVGDRVDAWVQESWQEGVITEKNKKDETTLTVHFPGSGETSVVRAWHLHPSLIWKDGKWIESSKVEANDRSTHEGDTPNEKRPKIGSNKVEVKGKVKYSKSSDGVESANTDETRLLNLTENERVFNIGKSSKNESKQDPHRMARTGLQKEGSRVIFGVPKPGKKRKFMDVSQHYVEHGKNNINDRSDSVKIPNLSGSLVWKNSSRNDTKEKHGASKPKTKFGKPESVLGRVIPPKDISLSNASSTTTDLTGQTERTMDSSNHLKSASQSESQVERAPDGATEGAILFSSRATSRDAPPTKKVSTSRASKGKLAPAGDKLGKGEVEKTINDNPSKPTSDVTAQRRSNRRIQPTSRLLEGLQSSLIISKIPSFSHNRNTSKGNNQG
ncbi:uncharacterized threonine-rich GPI-anchored glycoprotein PJ4664.02-like isoform X4 [Lotus japonicus]|uniref:uncharacterized threonine-rich GPI-anchored glycoprotein PJ4664.02-like isoform X4 n=1 Tax=Lotus japonicus TaxID=34305 RepID=UPI00258A74C8|nr:uncharacterized threonine-rich GPI-anchored glycoprotein PJ4664.02-like isoform X4 [Lotus japonicus]